MCGILGGVSRNINNKKYLQSLNKLSHRGPDDEGFLEHKNIFLGQKRLAIIDLSPTGKQPMKSNCPKAGRNLYLIFNGEIYNYKEIKKELENLNHNFFSNSDTEVILHSYEEWGIESFKKFRGMFACALYDEDNNEIILFRDRFGIKPLYYYLDDKNFIFSSEIKAFWQFDFIKKEINQKAVLDFLINGYIHQPETFYKNIFHLEAGYFLKVKIKENSFEIQKEKWADIFDYYQLPKEKISLNEAIIKTKEALLDSVNYHLVADVPVGLFLSGGIDSSILLYSMKELGHQKIQTVSAIFKGTSYDESEKINELVKIFQPNHLNIEITGKDFLENLENIFYHMDQPTVDGVNTYFVSLAAKKAGLKVVLSGLGGDELFYGYPSFFDLPKIRKIKVFLKITSAAKILKLFGEFNIKYQKLAEIIQAKNLEEEYLIYRSIFTPAQIKKIIHSDIFVNSHRFVDSDYSNHSDIIRHIRTHSDNSDYGLSSDYSLISYLEMSHYLKNQLLRDSDVFSMAHSIELRVPFVDNVLFEKVVPIPDEYKIKNNISKFLLKEILKGKVSEKILYQKKQGFVVPIELWLKNEAKEIVKEELLKSEIYRKDIVEKLLNMFFENKLHWSRIWSLFILNRFLK